MNNSPSSPIFPARNFIAMDFPAMFEDTGRAPLLNQPTNRLTIPDAPWSIWVWLVDVTNQPFLTCRGLTLFFQNRILLIIDYVNNSFTYIYIYHYIADIT